MGLEGGSFRWVVTCGGFYVLGVFSNVFLNGLLGACSKGGVLFCDAVRIISFFVLFRGPLFVGFTGCIFYLGRFLGGF